MAAWTMIIGPLLIAVGLVLNAVVLRANHDWNRRQCAAKMIEDWNPRTAEHRKAIERIKPGLIDVNERGEIVKLSAADAAKIYDCKPGDEHELFELRFHFIELLNYFEYIAAAYFNGVADQSMLEESFRDTMVKWDKVLSEFIQVFAKRRDYAFNNSNESGKSQKGPWGPYHDLISLWNSPAQRKLRRRTDGVFR